MLVIPAIDLKAGCCVRLYQGDMNQATIYSDDPVATALRWQSEGAERLHVVDLDGAVSGTGVNTRVIEQICQALTIPVQVGGGVRDLETIEKLLSRGVARVILGTVAYRRPEVVTTACERFPGHITVGIDARAGQVAVQGWTEATELDAITLAERCAGVGASEIIYTDITRDGTEQGVNLEATLALARAVSLPIIASGGVADFRDIERLVPLEPDGIAGVIVGRALYTGAVKLAEAIAIARGLAR
ncbi:MAG TPA: 1-(5-phosphoribosyl)-5-[(5-phosphoribosylamino)methylideneamino]imidazole-4-carboxamide isomerase [Candidatus Binatia bacterium]|jgi:phosphoribosylformimino-5-aminoimidazole carboxamide ribotide isomerase|nr:1-(5-phosphoribosyl)-5-[(5-phosphoribosylamino)methylideneamino]imidazole-4-carboxamide isomerase [Candidatus Binatia bacterium]